MARISHAPAEVSVPANLAELSIEQLIRHRVELMLRRVGDAPVADLHELVMREAERGLLGLMLDRCEGNRGQAANQLGLHRNTLRQKIERLGLESDRRRRPPRRAGR